MKVSEAHGQLALGAGVAGEVDMMSLSCWARLDNQGAQKITEMAISEYHVAMESHNTDENEKVRLFIRCVIYII